MFPRITWELVGDPLGYAEHTLGATGVYTDTSSNAGVKFSRKRGCEKVQE